MSRIRSLLPLVRHSVRTVRWSSLAVSSVLSALIVLASWRYETLPRDEAVRAVRWAMFPLVASGLTMSLETLDVEPAHVPVRLMPRRFVRLLVVLLALGAAWAVVMTLSSLTPGLDVAERSATVGPLPVGGLTLEIASFTWVALAGGGLVGRDDPHVGVIVGMGVTGAVVVLGAMVFPWVALYTPISEGSAAWRQAHSRWAILLVVGALGWLVSVCDAWWWSWLKNAVSRSPRAKIRRSPSRSVVRSQVRP